MTEQEQSKSSVSQKVELKFMGQTMFLKPEGDPEIMDQALETVRRRLADAEKRASGVSSHQVAILALLDLAEEYVRAKKRIDQFQEKIREKSGKLSELVKVELQ